MQGHGLPGYPKHSLAAAGCKHFAAFDGPFNEGDTIITNADEFWNYMPNFEQCVNAGSWSLMCTYANHQVLTVLIQIYIIKLDYSMYIFLYIYHLTLDYSMYF